MSTPTTYQDTSVRLTGDRRAAPTIEQVPSDEQLSPEMLRLLRELPPLRIQRYLALVPECFEGWQALLGGLYSDDLDPRLREIVICRVGTRAGCDYELFQHTTLAASSGVEEWELQEVLHAEAVRGLGDDADLLCQVADELHAGGPMTDDAYERFVGRFDVRTAMKWLILMGHYACVVRVLNGLRVQPEPTRELDGRSSPLG